LNEATRARIEAAEHLESAKAAEQEARKRLDGVTADQSKGQRKG